MMNSMFKKTLRSVLVGLKSEPRGKIIREAIGYTAILKNMLKSATHYESRAFNYKYFVAEILWYLSGDLSVEYISRFAKLRGDIADKDGKIHSNYGYLMLYKKNEHGYTQYQRVLDTLKADKDSRQAIAYYGGPFIQYKGNKDVICTISNQFFIRNNKLDCIVTMRSNDAFFGTPYDILWFSLLTQSIRLDLLETYPDLKLGKLYHQAGSMHIYSDFFDKAKQITKEKGYNLSTLLSESLLSISQEDIRDYMKLTLKALNDKKPQSWFKNFANQLLPIYINYH